jgi:hypothetical protein
MRINESMDRLHRVKSQMAFLNTRTLKQKDGLMHEGVYI